ncbi:MAG TPA: SMI1/KNR4 family protein [Candidatus Acidoferrum sp.]|nr:SMI1/KNR4 family protein [Candidatus Acidoferrum sp.]
MQNLPEILRGKVFIHPVTKEEFGTIRLPSAAEKFTTHDGESFDLLAEDDCGNCFTIIGNGSVLFWDHETDDRVHLADSLQEFISQCTDPLKVELDQNKVKSGWIDPAFAKTLGRDVPKDGWVKKPAKPK